jgi:Undecaprenyl-phosphate glucose phosphotransferase
VLRQQHRFFRNLLIAADAILIVAATILAYCIRFYILDDWIPPRGVHRYANHAVPFLIAMPLILGSMMSTGLYRARRDQRFFLEAVAILKAVAIGLMLTVAATTLARDVLYEGRNLSSLQWAVFGITTCSLLLTWRLAFRSALRAIRSRGWNLRHVGIVGCGRLGQVVVNTLRRNSWTGISPKYFISHHPVTSRTTCLDLPVKGGLNDLERILEAGEISGVIIAVPVRMTAELPGLMSRLEKFSLDVRIVPDMNPKYLPVNMAVNELDGMPILSLRESPLAGWGRFVKRAVDIVGALLALVIFAIPMAIIAVLVRLSGSGPVIFRQDRMSLNGQQFKLFKFRTMRHVDAEQQTLREGQCGTEVWTQRGDGRITSLGRFLRQTSLDELPQLFNVLLGEMSLVGPRPERPELIRRFREDWRGYMLRQNVKAGMTGWAQVNGLRGQTSLRKRLQYDLFYIRNWSLMFDLRILWITLFRGFVHPNAH